MDSRYLEKRTLKSLKETYGCGGHYLVAVSGGVDSVVMLEVLSRLKNAIDWQLTVVHVHHGVSENAAQNEYRNLAQNLVRKIALEKNYNFLTNDDLGEAHSIQIKSSEEALRNLRYAFFADWILQQKASGVLLAHQNQDWLESQLIQMIRGGGSLSNKQKNFKRLRPLADWSKQEVFQYANENQLTWLEDPSNGEDQTLRNWLRNKWLPDLENFRQGAVQTLGRSLELMQSQIGNSQELFTNQRLWLSSVEVSRPEFSALSNLDQRRVVAAMMNNSGVRNYSQSHIKEVVKRLDTNQNNLKFNTAKATWIVGPVAFSIHVDTRPDGSSLE